MDETRGPSRHQIPLRTVLCRNMHLRLIYIKTVAIQTDPIAKMSRSILFTSLPGIVMATFASLASTALLFSPP